MRYTVGSPSRKLLRRASRFAQPEGDDKGDGKGGDKSKDGKPDGEKPAGDAEKKKSDDKGGDKPPIPYARFREVSSAKKTAETALAAAQTEITNLRTQVEQLSAKDQSGAVKAAQEQVTALQKQITQIDEEFEEMLEVALANVPDEAAAMVRDVPGGARAQFAYFNKHRERIVGAPADPADKKDEKPKGSKGPTNEKKPDGDGKPGPSSAAKHYIETRKAPEKGFAGLV